MTRPVNAVVYDIEIIRAIPEKKAGWTPTRGIEYCAGWGDHANMLISVIGAYDYMEDRYRVFCRDNFQEFAALLAQRKCHVTFNGLAFDNKVIAAVVPKMENIGDVPTDYDLFVEIRAAAGTSSFAGFSLDAVCKENFGTGKTGRGDLAPIQWQRGLIGEVIDYCLTDVWLTKRCFDRVLEKSGLDDPRGGGKFLVMRPPVV